MKMPTSTSVIKKINKKIIVPDKIVNKIEDFCIRMQKDGHADAEYVKRNHSYGTLKNDRFNGILSEYAVYILFKRKKPYLMITKPDLSVWTKNQRIIKGRNDPDLKTERSDIHVKSTPFFRTNKKFRGGSWSFRLTDAITSRPIQKDVIICCTVLSRNEVLVNFKVKAVDVLGYYEKPIYDDYKNSKICLYMDTLKSL